MPLWWIYVGAKNHRDQKKKKVQNCVIVMQTVISNSYLSKSNGRPFEIKTQLNKKCSYPVFVLVKS